MKVDPKTQILIHVLFPYREKLALKNEAHIRQTLPCIAAAQGYIPTSSLNSSTYREFHHLGTFLVGGRTLADCYTVPNTTYSFVQPTFAVLLKRQIILNQSCIPEN